MRAFFLASAAMLLLAQPVLAQDAAQPLPSQQAPAEQMARKASHRAGLAK